MIKTIKTQCPWCHRPVHAILSYNEWQGECSVCHDGFTMPIDVTMCNREDGGDNE